MSTNPFAPAEPRLFDVDGAVDPSLPPIVWASAPTIQASWASVRVMAHQIEGGVRRVLLSFLHADGSPLSLADAAALVRSARAGAAA